MCKTFGALPSQVLAEDAEVLQLMAIYDRAHPAQEP
jgi:hypothetical protein